MAEQVEIALQHVPDTGRTEVVGGRRRRLRVTLNPERLASRQATPLDVDRVLRGANVAVQAGTLRADGREVLVESGPFVQSARELETLVVGVFAGKPVYLRDVAMVTDGPEEPASYTRIAFGPGEAGLSAGADLGVDFPAVTIGVAKRKGSNAVAVGQALEARLDELRGTIIPHDIGAG